MNPTVKSRSIAPASTDSDPNADELLHRVRRPRTALARAVRTVRRWHDDEIEAAYAERDQQFAERVDFEIAIGSAA